MTELERDMGAAAWAQELGLGNALYKDLLVGECFRFHGSDTVYRKYFSGYRVVKDEQRGTPMFRTGQRTAVWRVACPS